ncbi:MAG: hypothetical protein ABIR37_00210 [Candidatus Saccharimonadales bacterium]
MFGFQSANNLPYEELSHQPGSDQINEFQWVMQTFIGDTATARVAELHLPHPHAPAEKFVLAVHALHISNILHLHHQS